MGAAQGLLEEARRSCDRSAETIRESRAILDRHRTVMAALRTAARLSKLAGPPVNGDAERALDLDDEITVGPLRLLPLRRAVTGDDGRVLLTPSEWQLLAALVTHRSSVLSRSEIASRAWGPGFVGRHGEVEVYVSRLRRKLARAGGDVRIETVRGQGYRLTLGHGSETEPGAASELGDGVA
jgi:DNA-binding response OmpR family regulator